jgi:hypothetical protein
LGIILGCSATFKVADKKYNYILDNAKRIGWGSGGEGVWKTASPLNHT